MPVQAVNLRPDGILILNFFQPGKVRRAPFRNRIFVPTFWILRKTVEFAHSKNQKVGVQVAHAGQKAFTVSSRLHIGLAATESTSGWPDIIWRPSTVPFDDACLVLKELSKAQDRRRSKRLLSYPSLSKTRTDECGGSFDNCIRLTLEVVDVIRDVVPEAEDLHAALPEVFSNTTEFTGILAERGVDFLDVSSGGGHPKAIMKGGLAYQMPFAQAIKQAVVDKLAIGSFTDGKMSQEVLDKVQANVILRQLQRTRCHEMQVNF
ncbi:hypothetical protein CY34DRAFT_105173 [Suillus luteus UH-Slu-Lm8-n1]|uniref:NADH:flavin oxidoreductase/NADH oxidase N-terminal domain-containing protein n=1 Tax=Suillus luteus UH-Slu-Lm8-n1 TaxID=930992 RepID=A0A0D0BJT3_9AGAM|nr:hypothetical protein CY34DRAFT_105173 [Suillus luteus UH-Slu-Lm8-n1]